MTDTTGVDEMVQRLQDRLKTYVPGRYRCKDRELDISVMAFLLAMQERLEKLTVEKNAMEARAVSMFWLLPGSKTIGELQNVARRARELQAAEAEVVKLRAERAERDEAVKMVMVAEKLRDAMERDWSR